MADCKAWIVRENGEPYAAVVFAETRGKAKSAELKTRINTTSLENVSLIGITPTTGLRSSKIAVLLVIMNLGTWTNARSVRQKTSAIYAWKVRGQTMAEYIEREAVDWDVTHWMPLPEPPKEAEK